MKKLREYLERFKNKKTAVAYSGGVDSSLIAFYSRSFACAILVKTEFTPRHMVGEAIDFAEKHKIPYRIVEASMLDEAGKNPPDRCFLCKEKTFREIRALGYEAILDGTNADDLKEDRPGLCANQKFGVASPLAELGLGKEDVRKLMEKIDSKTAKKPSETCLATRIPFDSDITPTRLKRIDDAEDALRGLGFGWVRVRDHRPVARIQLKEQDVEKAAGLREKIAGALKALGYEYITLDLG